MHRVTAVIAATAIAARAASSPSVTIDAGKINGGLCKNFADAAYYKAIPFADPPVDDLRFAAPKAYSKKFPDDGLDGTKTATTCIQFGQQFAESGLESSEDCLYLNVWAPANATKDSNLPVRVWLYGGGNSDGSISDPLYDGCPVPSTGAVMVSINYRLGPLGFLSLKDAGYTGNQGIQDALLGLQWVQDNVAAFGGDPKKVLLHGESAGAIDSFAIATLEQAPKLFSAAIFQSGGGLPASKQSAVETISASLAKALNCDAKDSSCLQKKSSDDVKSAYTKISGQGSTNSDDTPSFAPCVDGKVIPVQPAGQAVRVPSVFGSNLQEGTLFVLAQYVNNLSSVKDSDYTDRVKQMYPKDADAILKQYPLDAFKDTAFPPLYALSELVTASSFKCPARRGLAAAAKKGVPVWAYSFEHKPKCSWEQAIPDYGVALLGATHSSEIPFVFNHTSDLPLPNGTCEMTDDEKKISDFMTAAWTAMAKDQKPGDNDTWPAWTDAQKSTGLTIVNGTSAGSLNYTECDLWDRIDQEQNGDSSSNSTSSGSGGSSPTSSAGGSAQTSPQSAASVTVINTMLVLGWSAALAAFMW